MRNREQKIVIFGTGEIAELADFYFTHDSEFEVAAFTADDRYIADRTFKGRPLVGVSELTDKYPPSEYLCHVALSYRKLNGVRQEKYDLIKSLGYRFASYVSTKSVTWPDLSHGDNCFILENQTVQPGVTIGNNVMIWSGNHLGHGCSIGDHTYISSHVCISGHTRIGSRCFIGVNSTFKDFVEIGDRVFVAMGATVVRDLKDDSVIVAPKSEIFEAGTAVAEKLRDKYFFR